MTDPAARAPRQPIFNVPPVTKALLVVNLAVQLAQLLLPAGLDDLLVVDGGLIPARYTIAGALGWPALLAPLTYQFIHGSWGHLAMNMVVLLAFGSGVERDLGGRRMLAFYLLCGILAGAAHVAAFPQSSDPVIGASGAISGLFGAILRRQFRTAGGRLWPLVLLWAVMIAATGAAGLGAGAEPVAWVAHLGGFAAGLVLVPLFAGRSRPRLGG